MRQLHPDTEVTVLALADRLGISRPTFQRAHRPEPWRCWSDRVMQAASLADRGMDPTAACAEAERYGGNLTTEARMLAVADRLQIPRPIHSQATWPEAWSWWAETVAMAETVATAGGDVADLRRRAISFDGSARPWPSPDLAPVDHA